jgi:hypothetical protein
MKQGNWWGRKSGAGKTMLVLLALLFCEIALCLATPVLEARVDSLMHIPQGEGWGTFGVVLWELWLIALTLLLMLCTAVWRLVGSSLRKVSQPQRTLDEGDDTKLDKKK